MSDKEFAAGEVPGLERAVGKSKGVEFGSLVHQLGADYLANPFSAQVRDILLAIDPEAAKRFPQRRQPRPEAAAVPDVAEVAPPPPAPAGRKRKSEAAAPAKPPVAEDASAESNAAESKATEGKPAEGKKATSQPSKKAAESSQEPLVPGKPHDKTPKAEKGEKAEKQSKPEKSEKIEKAEKQEKRPVEASRNPPAADALGKRKPR